MKDYSYIIAGTSPQFNASFFERAENLKLLIRFGIGYNNIDVEAAKRYGILCANVPSDLEKYDVAEQAVTLLLAVSKHLTKADTAARKDEWSVKRERFLGIRVRGRTIGIIGYGNIGSAFAEIMKYGFNCRVIAYDPYVSAERMQKNGVCKVTFDELIADSDFISLHLSLTEETCRIISREVISRMKKTCVLINTARGELVDEEAIADALMNDQLGGYGTDVIDNEPIKMSNRLLQCKNVVITPHLSVYNLDCNKTMNEAVVNDVIRVSNGELPVHMLY